MAVTCKAVATIADAIFDRLLSRSHRLALKGKSMRPRKAANSVVAGDEIVAHNDATSEPQ